VDFFVRHDAKTVGKNRFVRNLLAAAARPLHCPHALLACYQTWRFTIVGPRLVGVRPTIQTHPHSHRMVFVSCHRMKSASKTTHRNLLIVRKSSFG
jgi:hypothetical protein